MATIKPSQSDRSPFLDAKPPNFQFSLSGLLMAMAVFSLMSASLLWASRLPKFTDELHSWMGTVPSTNHDGSDRGTQLMFLIFCYASPLLMAATVNIIVLSVRATERSLNRRRRSAESDWRMES